ncbi:unnamed protein product [Musa acuminata subsp. burmannicoides]
MPSSSHREPMVGNLVSPSLAAAKPCDGLGNRVDGLRCSNWRRHAGVLGAPRGGISIALRHRARQGGGSRQPGMGSTDLAMSLLMPRTKQGGLFPSSTTWVLPAALKWFSLQAFSLHVYPLQIRIYARISLGSI